MSGPQSAQADHAWLIAQTYRRRGQRWLAEVWDRRANELSTREAIASDRKC